MVDLCEGLVELLLIVLFGALALSLLGLPLFLLVQVLGDGLLARFVRQVRRHPQFSMWGLMEVTVVVALGMSIYCWTSGDAWRTWGIAKALCVGFGAAIFAVGIVVGMHAVLGDVWELFVPRRRRSFDERPEYHRPPPSDPFAPDASRDRSGQQT